MRFILFFFFILSFASAQEADSAMVKVEKMIDDKIIFDSKMNQKMLEKIILDALKKDQKVNQNMLLEMLKRKELESIESIIEDDSETSDARIIISDLELKTTRLSGPSQFDSRIELLQLDPMVNWQFEILQKSESVGIIIEKENLSQLAKDTYFLNASHSLGSIYNLCNDVPFYNQTVAGIGTAFIVSKNTMLTANHVFERPITDYIVLFGYKLVVANDVVNYYFNVDDIYYPKTVSKKEEELDLIEFKVDRDFNRPILEWENVSKIPSNENEVYMIGHPTGLPTKVALNASIKENTNPFYFYTSLDSFQGNSGSPVFNFYTHKVIGVLVSGEVDYVYNGNCYYSPSCKIPFCKGEKVIRIEKFME